MKGKREQTGDNDKIFRLGIGLGVHDSKLHLLNSDFSYKKILYISLKAGLVKLLPALFGYRRQWCRPEPDKRKERK